MNVSPLICIGATGIRQTKSIYLEVVKTGNLVTLFGRRRNVEMGLWGFLDSPDEEGRIWTMDDGFIKV